ncbi:signal recognition particle 19 kDa protein [Condylostylus longicornis]|uniref:signal recognition particle 19 kDa protein n=1 Tax=Condylostylus longicornis TaxID=2530218 RepID=UPI00244DA679|nr:signal recognition particle 19 kDa protein [Condylostylus longicornis]
MAAAGPVKTPWSPDKKNSDIERWVCIYPAYINSKKTRQEGRRVAKQYCVENPTYVEIRDVLSTTNLRIGVENKLYSREKSKELNYRGRIRVQLKNDDGTPCNPELPTRDSLLIFAGTRIPQLKSRQNPKSTEGSTQPAQSGGGGGGGHKKGKGKRR